MKLNLKTNGKAVIALKQLWLMLSVALIFFPVLIGLWGDVIVTPAVRRILTSMTIAGMCSSMAFMRDGERITSRQIAYVLEKYAERQGTATKSTHKMRKTYASNLNANGVLLDCIREMLGHSSLSTTLGYVYNPLTESETYNLISQAL